MCISEAHLLDCSAACKHAVILALSVKDKDIQWVLTLTLCPNDTKHGVYGNTLSVQRHGVCTLCMGGSICMHG